MNLDPEGRWANAQTEHRQGSNSALNDGLSTRPVVKQTHQIMVGRKKSGLIFIQIDMVTVQIEPEMVDDLVAALLMAKSR